MDKVSKGKDRQLYTSTKDRRLKEELLYSSYNQINSNFVIGTNKGFKIYSSESGQCCIIKNFPNEKVLCVKTYLDSNLIAYISENRNEEETKTNPAQLNSTKQNQILNIYDLKRDRILTQIKFQSEIKNFNISYKKLYVALENDIFVFELFTYTNTHYFHTKPNPLGIFANSLNDDIIVFPGDKKNFITIRNLETQTVYDFNFEESYQNFFMNKSASLLAVVNLKGDQIKIVDLESFSVIKTLKRGMGEAVICSVSFNDTDEYMAASSNKGTVHIWHIMTINPEENSEEINEKAVDNKQNSKANTVTSKPKSTSGHTGILKKLFYSGDKSFVKFHLKENFSFVGFIGKTKNVFIIAESGYVYFAEGSEKDETLKITKNLFLLN